MMMLFIRLLLLSIYCGNRKLRKKKLHEPMDLRLLWAWFLWLLSIFVFCFVWKRFIDRHADIRLFPVRLFHIPQATHLSMGYWMAFFFLRFYKDRGFFRLELFFSSSGIYVIFRCCWRRLLFPLCHLSKLRRCVLCHRNNMTKAYNNTHRMR